MLKRTITVWAWAGTDLLGFGLLFPTQVLAQEAAEPFPAAQNSGSWAAVLLGSLLILGLYHLLLYLLRPHSKSSLYLGALCTLAAASLPLRGQVLLIPGLNLAGKGWLALADLISAAGLPLVLALVSVLYPGRIHRTVWGCSLFVAAVFALLAVVDPTPGPHGLGLLYYAYGLLIGPYILYVMITGSTGRCRERMLVTAGAASLLAALIQHVFFYREAMDTGWMVGGVLGFAVLQSMALSLRYSEAYAYARRLAWENINLVEQMEDMVEKRTLELNQTVEQLNREIQERAALAEQLKVCTTTDAVTGLLNRSMGMTLLVNQLHMAERKQWPLTISYVSINHLKWVNGQFGHQAGEEILKTAGQMIRENIRESDSAFQMASDEFVIIFPQCSLAEAELIWERILHQMRLRSQERHYSGTISFSFGLAQYQPGSCQPVADLIKQAHHDLHDAQQMRGDQARYHFPI